MSDLPEKLQTELENDDQLASLRVDYTFQEKVRLEGAGTYYRATPRSGDEEVAVRFFDLQGTDRLQGLDTTGTLEERTVARDDESPQSGGQTAQGLGEISNSIQDPETDAIEGSVSATDDGESEPEEMTFERADVGREDLLVRLGHPNLVDIEAHGRGERTLAFVTEEIGGHALSRHVYDGALRGKPDRAAVIGRDVARALGYIHERGVLHLDLKPENIVRDDTGEVRLLNVGVTVLVEETLEEGEIRAAPEYVAPERVDAEDGRIGPWTDLYSLGVVLYHAATGEAPFTGSEPSELLNEQLHASPTPPRSINSKISPFLERVILRLLAKDPTDRYRSADELEWDLEKYLDRPPSERFDVRREPRVWDTGLSAAGGVFFGRQSEMERLTKHLTVEANRPRVALLRGSQGVGKSALLEHYIERLERQDLGPVYARASGDLDSVAAVVMLARGAVRKILESRQFDTGAWEQHFRGASPATRTLVSRIPRLGRLLSGKPRATESSDDNRRVLMRNVIAWRDLFELFMTGPDEFTWIVDDLHRIGELSGEILAEFIHRRTDLVGRWLLGQTPGETPGGDEWVQEHVLEAESAVEVFGLEALERKQVREYFDDLFHASDETLDRFVDRLMGVSGGRPELIQIALQQWTSGGAVEFRAGKLRVEASKLEEIELADDLVEYALEAWEDLDTGERELAYNVALVGDCIPAALLLEIASVSEEVFEDRLSTLVARRILETTPATHGRLVSCSEQTVREFVRKQLTPSEFERRHRMLAFECTDYYELVDEDRFDDGWLCVNTAQQWVAAGEPERAVDSLASGGRIRLTEGRVLNALRLLREGETRTDDPFEVRADGLSLVELLGDALAAAAEGEEAVEQYQLALDRTRDVDEQQRLRLKLGRGLQQRQDYDRSYRVVCRYLEERSIEVPASEERLAFGVLIVLVKYLVIRALYRLGVFRPEPADDASVTGELDNFEAAQMLTYNLRQRGQWFPLIWLGLSTEHRAHQLGDGRVLAVNLVEHARLCTRVPRPLPGRAGTFRDRAVARVQTIDDDRVRSYVGASAAAVSLRLGDHEQALEYAREFRPVTVTEGSFSDYQDILETLIHLALYGGHLSAADKLVNRFVADAGAFGTYEVTHLTHYFEAYVEFLRGDFAEARKHLGQSRSANQRAQDDTCVALQDWIDFELLWRYGQRRQALTTAREAVDDIDGELRDDKLNETICRAARLASRAALEAREGNLQENPWELLQFAERCCELAADRTAAFPTLRAMVHCEQGRLAWIREDPEEAIGRLDQAILVAETFGQIRFQAVAYEVRSHVKADSAPLHALVDARRSRALYQSCGLSKAVERLDEDLETLLERQPNLEPFSDRFGIRRPETADLEPSREIEGSRTPFRTIELSPEAEEVEVFDGDETLRPWQGEGSGVASLVPPSPEDEREADAPEATGGRSEPPSLDDVGGGAKSEAEEDGENGELPMPPSPDKPTSLQESSSPEDESSVLPTPSAASAVEVDESAASEEGESGEEVDPPTLPETADVEPVDREGDGDGEETDADPSDDARQKGKKMSEDEAGTADTKTSDSDSSDDESS